MYLPYVWKIVNTVGLSIAGIGTLKWEGIMPTVISCVDIACLVDFRQYLLSMLGSESLYVGQGSPRHTHDYAANAPWYSICSQNILLLSVVSYPNPIFVCQVL